MTDQPWTIERDERGEVTNVLWQGVRMGDKTGYGAYGYRSADLLALARLAAQEQEEREANRSIEREVIEAAILYIRLEDKYLNEGTRGTLRAIHDQRDVLADRVHALLAARKAGGAE